jgi:hypothetical protein
LGGEEAWRACGQEKWGDPGRRALMARVAVTVTVTEHNNIIIN